MKFRTSFGLQLTCLVLIIVLPATLVTAYDFATSLSDKRESSYAYLQSIADQCAHDLDGLIRSTLSFLKDVSDLVETLNERRGALQPALARILENHPECANIRLLDRDGLLLASAIPAQHPVSYGDRVEVSQAIAGGSSAVGRPVLGKITGVMTLPVTGPLYNARGELESFAYSVSHDLRAPLRGIAGFSAILLEDHGEALGEAGAGLLTRVDDGARKMGELIDGLLQFSRVSRVELNRQMTDMDALLREMLVDSKAQLESQGIELAVHRLGLAACDRGAFTHVFSNLISNAVKYTRSRPLPRIEIGCDESERDTVYYVRDNGIGFDMKYADTLTQVFQKLHPNYEGSGVGLAIVKRVVEKHGGKLWPVSAPGQGATFFFSLPKTPPPTIR